MLAKFGALVKIVLEKVQLKFFKYVFNLKKSTPSYMIYGELGIFPIVLDMKYRTISYWIKLIENASSDNVKLSTKTYLMLYNLYNVNFVNSKWIENVKNILVECGLPGVWYNQYFLNVKLLKSLVLQKLKDIFIQHWHSDIERTSNTNLYKHFKTSFGTSNYITILDNNNNNNNNNNKNIY